ncbi:hypothetical protein CLF_109625 [Clonorchis sinensis]|uniref:Uncharacterized protein n=1 Tax=Clonorchis sinensis TaxID=79923 RepID=G7YJL1_CLOSI|nr:hypothetical protein CLF_109625 [Clonorchis sinensis]
MSLIALKRVRANDVYVEIWDHCCTSKQHFKSITGQSITSFCTSIKVCCMAYSGTLRPLLWQKYG